MPEEKQIRAHYTDKYIRVYQAYNNNIAESALVNQKFTSPPFKLERTTWIKPSFFWMMYRCGWAAKENQERVLAIDITHEGFKWAISNSVLSHFVSSEYDNYNDWLTAKETKPVVIQWDPERDIFLNKLNYRSIQIGLTPPAAKLYAEEWILKIDDITDAVKKIKLLIDNLKIAEAKKLLPNEQIYLP